MLATTLRAPARGAVENKIAHWRSGAAHAGGGRRDELAELASEQRADAASTETRRAKKAPPDAGGSVQPRCRSRQLEGRWRGSEHTGLTRSSRSTPTEATHPPPSHRTPRAGSASIRSAMAKRSHLPPQLTATACNGMQRWRKAGPNSSCPLCKRRVSARNLN